MGLFTSEQESAKGETATREVTVDEIDEKVIWFKTHRDKVQAKVSFAVPRDHGSYDEELHKTLNQLTEDDDTTYTGTFLCVTDKPIKWIPQSLVPAGSS